MTRKDYMLGTDELDIITGVMKKYNFKKEVQALRFIIRRYEQYAEEEVKGESTQLKIIMKILRDMEDKERIMYDAVNTLLINKRIEKCIPVSMLESPVYSSSNEYFKDQLAKKKQIKDNRHL